jgi:hypothetical protein
MTAIKTLIGVIIANMMTSQVGRLLLPAETCNSSVMIFLAARSITPGSIRTTTAQRKHHRSAATQSNPPHQFFALDDCTIFIA